MAAAAVVEARAITVAGCATLGAVGGLVARNSGYATVPAAQAAPVVVAERAV